MDELSRSRGSEGYGACADDGDLLITIKVKDKSSYHLFLKTELVGHGTAPMAY